MSVRRVTSPQKMSSISFGENISFPDGTFNLRVIRSVLTQLDDLAKRGYHIAIVVGTGGASKPYLEAATRYEKRKERLDELVKEVSKANAMLLIAWTACERYQGLSSTVDRSSGA